MGTSRTVTRPGEPIRGPVGAGSARLSRGRPRSFVEWQALRRWGKLPRWETQVAGYLLRQAREDAGLTQRDLGRRLGVSQQAIAQAERWQANPTVDFMRRWLEACNAGLRIDIDVPAGAPAFPGAVGSGPTASRRSPRVP